MVRAADALDDVQLVRMREASAVDPGLFVKADGVNDQRVSLVPANRIPHPGQFRVPGMLAPIGEDLADMVIELEIFKHTTGSLNHLQREGLNINPGHAGGKATNVLARGR